MRFGTVLLNLRKHPQFTLMRSLARFPIVRNVVRKARGRWQSPQWSEFCALQQTRLRESMFQDQDPLRCLNALKKDGVALGLRLPDAEVEELRLFADQNLCFAERNPVHGFLPAERTKAEAILGKPIVTAHYFNVDKSVAAAARLSQDPFLLLVAAQYLESLPRHVGTNMWWSFPVEASEEDRSRNAQVYHADVDDFAFLKFFFYLTDVSPGDGTHVCVPGSQRSPLIARFSDRWNIRRYRDDEVERHYGSQAPLEIHGSKGTGFAEDTLCIHRGMPVVARARLLIQVQYALFDYKVQSDYAEVSSLKRLA